MPQKKGRTRRLRSATTSGHGSSDVSLAVAKLHQKCIFVTGACVGFTFASVLCLLFWLSFSATHTVLGSKRIAEEQPTDSALDDWEPLAMPIVSGKGAYYNLSAIGDPNANEVRNATVIVSGSIPLADFANFGESNHWLYASLHGYYYVSNHRNHVYRFQRNGSEVVFRTRDFRAHYSKPAVIKWLLADESVGSVLWIDSDALFIDCRKSVDGLFIAANKLYTSQLKQTFDAHIILSGASKTSVNSGVIVLRNSAFSREFVDNWFALSRIFGQPSHKRATRFHDQSALLMAVTGATVEMLKGRSYSALRSFAHRFEAKATHFRTWAQQSAFDFHRRYVDASLRPHIALMKASFMNANRKTIEVESKFVVHFAGESHVEKKKLMAEFGLKSNCVKELVKFTENNVTVL